MTKNEEIGERYQLINVREQQTMTILMATIYNAAKKGEQLAGPSPAFLVSPSRLPPAVAFRLLPNSSQAR